MAKSARASTVKRNHAALRSAVYAPDTDARTARLAAKLQELASQPRPERPQNNSMEVDASGPKSKGNDSSEDTKMALDNEPTPSISSSKSKKKSHRVRKHSNRKNRSSIVFRKPKHLESRKK
ncbi:hypothetical protein VTN49DRAFT_3726 [Thermomyces lanuginosus]|uniref:uncharacterized protein n=1 Tax=Thermomyces lanuginosus TaxID=5541 RepID=UPI0037444801